MGIGKGISESELEIIAGDRDRVIAANSFADLTNRLDSIRQAANGKNFLLTLFKRVVLQYSFIYCIKIIIHRLVFLMSQIAFKSAEDLILPERTTLFLMTQVDEN